MSIEDNISHDRPEIRPELPPRRMPWEVTVMPDQKTLESFLKSLMYQARCRPEEIVTYSPVTGTFETIADISKRAWEVT